MGQRCRQTVVHGLAQLTGGGQQVLLVIVLMGQEPAAFVVEADAPHEIHGQGPYKDHLWFCVRTGDQDWTGRPAFYFEIAPDYYSYGMGFWAASAATMTRYRQQIDRDPKTLEKLVRQFDRQQVFQLTGPDYVRSKGQVSDLLRPWYQKKSLTLAHEVPLDESLYSPAFAARVTEDLKTLLPFYRYFAALCAAAE